MKAVLNRPPGPPDVPAPTSRRELRARQVRAGRRRGARFLRRGLVGVLVLGAAGFALNALGLDPGYASTSIHRLGNVGPAANGMAENGIRQTYRAAGDGTITGVRFRAVSNTPTAYLVSVWSSDGVLRGWAATRAESGGWRTATFGTPVSTRPGTSFGIVYWASPQKLASRSVRGSDVGVLWSSATSQALGAPEQVVLPPGAPPSSSAASSPSGSASSSSPAGSAAGGKLSSGTASGGPLSSGQSSGSPAGVQSGGASLAVLPAFPNDANTGVPAGTSLKASGTVSVTTPGAVINALDVSGYIDVQASNVTIRNTRVRGGSWWSIRVRPGLTGVVIEDCTIDGLGTSGMEGSMGVQGPVTVLRTDIKGVENGIAPDSGSVLQDNYVHDLGAPGAAHYDGIQIDGGSANITIRHNTVLNQFPQTSAVMIDNYFGPVNGVTVDGNYLGGGGYTVYSDGQFSGGSITGVRFTNNRMLRGSFGFASVNRNTVVDTGNVDASSNTALRLS